LNFQPKGELGGPGKLVNQDRLVANAHRSFSLKFHWPSRHEGFSTVWKRLNSVKVVCWYYS